VLSNADMDFAYRHCGAPGDLIFTEALLEGEAGDASLIEREMNEITTAREATQPVKSRTGGSTFKNPDGLKAWELIDKAGLRGLRHRPGAGIGEALQFPHQRGRGQRRRSRGAGRDHQAAGDGNERHHARMGDQAHRRAGGPARDVMIDPESTHVAVLMGGWSAEREVSLASGKACADALRIAGFEVTTIDADRAIATTLSELRPDVVFNALHGKWGEDGTVQGVLETLQIPYTHSGILASALAMNKPKAKQLFRAAGIPVAHDKVADIEHAASTHVIPPPYVVKPVDEGSSVGVLIVEAGANAPPAGLVELRHVYGDRVFVEAYVPGRELTCAVIGDVALGVIDIVPAAGFYDYKAKYAPGGSVHVLPAEVPQDIYRKVQQCALEAHMVLGCRGVSRADFRFNDAPGVENPLVLLEVNTQPGMTGTSLVPEMAQHAGHSFPDLVTWMVQDASLNR
jgi:D-alanine-D-alanine ligase